MSSKEIHVRSWEEIRDLLPKEIENNIQLIDLISEISNYFKNANRNYVYHVKLEYGDLIINKGKTTINDFIIAGNSFKRTKSDFNNDILYSDDPLGIVLTNYIEVYTENRSAGEGAWRCSYTVPVNILRAGDMFGVFGTLDMFSNIIASNLDRDWFARAGNVSFGLAFPFHNQNELEFISNCSRKYRFISGKEEYHEAIPGDLKVNFVKDFVNDWYADVAYLPRHYFTDLPEGIVNKFQNYLFSIGWQQSAHMRSSLFEDTTVYNLIANARDRTFKHDKNFLGIFYNYIKKALRGEADLLKPLIGRHVIWDAIEVLKLNNNGYFKTAGFKEPLPFIFGRLKYPDDWGIVSINQLPIIYNYTIKSLNILLSDIEKINEKIDESTKILNKDFYKVNGIFGYGNTGGKPGVNVNKTKDIREILSKSFSIEPCKINLSSKEFSNLLLLTK